MIPAHKDKDGYYVDPKSECCRAGVVYYDKAENLYIRIPVDHEKLVRTIEFRCARCDRVVSRQS